MSSTSQQTILSAFNNAAGSQGSGGGAAGGQSNSTDQGLTDALTQATQVIDAQTDATSANTDALGVETQTKSSGSSGSSAASDAVSTVSSVLGGGLSLLPLISIFTSLFGGGQAQQPAPLVPYSMPPALNLQTTTNDQDVTYGENGLPKTANQPSTNQPAANQQTSSQPAGSQPASTGASSTQQITVQVQAMDSQSFLDHSDDIAQAVRRAMLNMSSLNDIVNDL
jgi:hypothetical protein